MSKLFGYGESLESKTEKTMQNCESLMDLVIKANGSSIMDVFGNDVETGTVIGGCMSLYNNAKELAIMQAKAMDNILNDFDDLKEMNQKLCKQNEELQQMLRELSVSAKKGI